MSAVSAYVTDSPSVLTLFTNPVSYTHLITGKGPVYLNIFSRGQVCHSGILCRPVKFHLYGRFYMSIVYNIHPGISASFHVKWELEFPFPSIHPRADCFQDVYKRQSSYRLLNTATTKPAFATEDIRNAAGINNRQFFGAAKDINNVSPAKSQMEVFKTNSRCV